MNREDMIDKHGRTLQETIIDAKTHNYPKPALTADCAIFAVTNGEVRLLTIRRGGHPCLGMWALPGGFADPGETIEMTAARELEEETCLTGVPVKLVGVYSAPGRDVRGWTVTCAFAAVIDGIPENAHASDDAAEICWARLTRDADGALHIELPDDEGLAFDHRQIIEDAARAVDLP